MFHGQDLKKVSMVFMEGSTTSAMDGMNIGALVYVYGIEFYLTSQNYNKLLYHNDLKMSFKIPG